MSRRERPKKDPKNVEDEEVEKPVKSRQLRAKSPDVTTGSFISPIRAPSNTSKLFTSKLGDFGEKVDFRYPYDSHVTP